jgi:hypothetical protein
MQLVSTLSKEQLRRQGKNSHTPAIDKSAIWDGLISAKDQVELKRIMLPLEPQAAGVIDLIGFSLPYPIKNMHDGTLVIGSGSVEQGQDGIRRESRGRKGNRTIDAGNLFVNAEPEEGKSTIRGGLPTRYPRMPGLIGEESRCKITPTCKFFYLFNGSPDGSNRACLNDRHRICQEVRRPVFLIGPDAFKKDGSFAGKYPWLYYR